MSTHRISPGEALDRLFSVIREEASANPTFARRLLEAVDISVVFSGEEAALAADPVLIAARNDYASFREMLITFPDAILRKMVTSFDLGTAEDVKRVKTSPKKVGYIDLLWEGARRKLAEHQL